jgi:hypothetical protein
MTGVGRQIGRILLTSILVGGAILAAVYFMLRLVFGATSR